MIAAASVVVLASEGIRAAPGVLLAALAAAVVPVTSRLPAYEELLSEGRYGLEFEPGDVQTLATHLERVIGDPELRDAFRSERRSCARRCAGPASRTSSRTSTARSSRAATTAAATSVCGADLPRGR